MLRSAAHLRNRLPITAMVCGLSCAPLVTGCDHADTFVVLDNDYPPASPQPLVVYRAFWQAVSFQDAVAPGTSSEPQTTLAASPNTAYVLLAPGWDPTSPTPPTSFVVLQSRVGFGVNLYDTLHIPVADTTFIGNCTAGSVLSQAQADFITQRIFPSTFASLRYDAATCTTTPVGDAGAD